MANLFPYPVFHGWDSNGDPLAGGKLSSYEPGTLTPKATYTDITGMTANANPTILNANGFANVWLDGGYRLILTDADDVEIWDIDNINVQVQDFNVVETTTRSAAAGAGVAEDLQDDIIPENTLSTSRVLQFNYAGQMAVASAQTNELIIRVNTTDVVTDLSAGAVALTPFRIEGRLYMVSATQSLLYATVDYASSQESYRASITSFDASAGFNLKFRVERENGTDQLDLEAHDVLVVTG